MLPPQLIDALYIANQADARMRELERERAQRATPPRHELRALDRQPAPIRGNHRSGLQWLRSLVLRSHTGPAAATGADDAAL